MTTSGDLRLILVLLAATTQIRAAESDSGLPKQTTTQNSPPVIVSSPADAFYLTVNEVAIASSARTELFWVMFSEGC